MIKKIYFISKDANWQLYRLEVFTKLAEKYNYKFEILTTGELKPYLEDNEYVKYKKFRSFFPLSTNINFFPGALQYIVKNKPDFVLVIINASNFTEFLSIPLCKILNIPVVIWTHGYDHGIRKKGLINDLRLLITRFFQKRADHIFTFSRNGKEYLISKDIPKEKITVTPNTLNTDVWLDKYNYCEKSKLRKKYNYKKESIVLLFSGRLYKDKKVMNLLYVIEYIQKEHKNYNIFLNIVGDGSERQTLEDYVHQNKIKNIIFHGNIFDESKIAEIFCISDLFVMPGCVGLAIVHAFCFGLPIITEDIFCHGPEIQYLEDNINGYLIEENDIISFANKLLYLSADNVELQKISNNALLTARGNASIDNMIKMMDLGFKKI